MLDNGMVPWTHREILLLAQAAMDMSAEDAADILTLLAGVIYKMDDLPHKKAYETLLENLTKSCIGLQ